MLMLMVRHYYACGHVIIRPKTFAPASLEKFHEDRCPSCTAVETAEAWAEECRVRAELARKSE